MNRKGVKAISGVLCASMLMGNVTPVFAATTDTQTTSNETDTKEVEVTYDKSASYFVTIPKTITLDSNKESTYNVKVEGDIPSDRNVYVAPQDAILQTDTIDFYMYDQSTKNPKEDVVAIVTYNKDTWDFEDVANGVEETNNKISASQLTAGNWKGTFNFNINLRDVEVYGVDVSINKDNLNSKYFQPNSGNIIIPSVVTDAYGIKHKVTSIEAQAFMNCNDLTSIRISNGIIKIENMAFFGCNNLTLITIPQSVTTIEGNTFIQCNNLSSITLPDNIANIGGSAFYGCSNLNSVTYKGVTYTNEKELTNALLSNGVSVGSNVFNNTQLQ